MYSSGVGLSLGSGDHVSLMGALSVPGLLCRLVCCLVSTSDVALLCRIFDVVLGLVLGARVPSPGLSLNTWALSLLLGSGSWVQLGLTCPELVDGR